MPKRPTQTRLNIFESFTRINCNFLFSQSYISNFPTNGILKSGIRTFGEKSVPFICFPVPMQNDRRQCMEKGLGHGGEEDGKLKHFLFSSSWFRKVENGCVWVHHTGRFFCVPFVLHFSSKTVFVHLPETWYFRVSFFLYTRMCLCVAHYLPVCDTMCDCVCTARMR